MAIVNITATKPSHSFTTFSHKGADNPPAANGMLFWFMFGYYSDASSAGFAAVLVCPAFINEGLPAPVFSCAGAIM